MAVAAARALSPQARLTSIDALRGLAMVIMALDHTRDFFSGATFDPTDLSRTNALLFFSRWITHFCAPVFVLLAGTGAYLALEKSRDRCELSVFLLKRGLWLMFLEVAVVSPLGWAFSGDFGFTRLQVIWAIGASMVVLAGLVFSFPPRAIGVFGLVLVFGHNAFDGPHAAWLGVFASTWKVLHSVSIFQPFPHKVVASVYPIIPWVGVMAVGFGFGDLALREAGRRRRISIGAGLTAVALFVVLRAANVYGDPRPWAVQADWPLSVMSFVNCNKYPPSLLYLLMTLGPALCFLALADRLPLAVGNALTVFGRVPLFYYLLHLPLLHGAAVGLAYLRFGRAGWLLQDSMARRDAAHALPVGFGYELWVVYLVWVLAVAALYPLCRWYGGVKRRRRYAVLSYL